MVIFFLIGTHFYVKVSGSGGDGEIFQLERIPHRLWTAQGYQAGFGQCRYQSESPFPRPDIDAPLPDAPTGRSLPNYCNVIM